MKRIFLFMSVAASVFIAGCSQEKITPDNNGNGEVTNSYMAVNLMSSDVLSRTTESYEDGTTDENEVTSVRFYFFTENGAAANVKLKGNSYVNYYDWTPGETGNDKEADVEKKLAATIVISTKEGDNIPQMVAAVLNPSGLDDSSKSLGQLKGITADYTTLTSSGKFVMFNSVYGKGQEEVCAVPIKADNLQKTEDLARKNPVTIYVERSVAKVRVVLAKEIGFDNDNKLALNDKNETPITIEGKQVYLKLGGWSLTADTSDGRLVKKIDLGWTSGWWNSSHRSFWAINSDSAKNRYHNYASIDTQFSSEIYTNENAAKLADATNGLAANNTKVIIKGTLCDENGIPFTLVRHVGAHMADTYSDNEPDNLPKLKESILSQLKANDYNYYFETEETDGTKKRTQIGTDDIKIVIADQSASENSKSNCYVYAQLTDEAAAKVWYSSSDVSMTTPTEAKVINGKLKDKNVVDRALVWKSGMTYYYFEIVHHGTGETATKGVVRNHIYETRVTKIAGLGTPVYDPKEEIYPEKPESNDHYIAAEINILSWRLVSNDYTLEW